MNQEKNDKMLQHTCRSIDIFLYMYIFNKFLDSKDYQTKTDILYTIDDHKIRVKENASFSSICIYDSHELPGGQNISRCQRIKDL